MLVSFTGGRFQEEGGSQDIAAGHPTEGSAPTSSVMISSLAIVVVLCGVAVSEESKLVKVVTGKEKVEPMLEYQESQSGYPVIVQQPYPIIVEKRILYNEEQYDRNANPGGYTSTGEQFGYGPEVVRSPIIFTVSSQPAQRTLPYPLRIQKDTWPLPCTGEDPNCLSEEFDFPPKYPVKKKNTYKSSEGVKEDNIKASDYGKIEGSVQHRESFQTPILIAIEKPGYKYVKHLVGVGVLPKARQFHVLILEEDVPTDNPNHEGLNSAESVEKKVLNDQPSKDILNDKKRERKAEESKDRNGIILEGSDAEKSEIIFPSTKEGSKPDNDGSLCKDGSKKTGQDKRDDQMTAPLKHR